MRMHTGAQRSRPEQPQQMLDKLAQCRVILGYLLTAQFFLWMSQKIVGVVMVDQCSADCAVQPLTKVPLIGWG
jgi:hypothetical protein